MVCDAISSSGGISLKPFRVEARPGWTNEAHGQPAARKRMKNLTRRDFLETAAQAALAGTAIIRADFLYGRAPDRARDSHPGGGEFGHARLPLSSLIFPEPKNIS